MCRIIFFNDTATTEIYTLSLHDALPIFAFGYSESSYGHWLPLMLADRVGVVEGVLGDLKQGHLPNVFAEGGWKDRKSTRLNSSHANISYAVFCLKKKKFDLSLRSSISSY